MKSFIALTAAVAIVACAHAPKKARSAAPTGIEAFTRFPKFAGARISPHGAYLALLNPEHGQVGLVFIDLKTRKLASRFAPVQQSVAGYHWINDERVLVELADGHYGSLAVPPLTGELTAVNPATGNGVTVFGARAVRNASYALGFVLARIRGDDRHAIIETIERERFAQVYKLDVYIGSTTPVTVRPARGARFLIDEEGEPRVAIAEDAKAKLNFYYRPPGAHWTELTTLKGVGARSRPVGFVSGTRTLDIVEPIEKGFGLFSANIETGERKLMSRNEWAPPDGFLLDHGTRRILAVEYEADVPSWEFVEPDHPMARVLRGLLDAYPGEGVQIVSATDDEKTVVARIYSDRDPGRYFLVDVASMQAEEIASARPWIRPDAMAEMNAFHIKASDGVWIHGYLTLPRSTTPGAPPPMVVIPHGGPHGPRNYWGFDPEAQLLASEGFAVLQVNFRGSGGYGLQYMEAGYGHWGDRIMEDIVDATRWAIGKGHADPKGICIYGGSFGGYAAMQASIVAPDLFRCAVGYAGVYDLTLIGSKDDIAASYIGRGVTSRYVGDDEDERKRISPAFHADGIKGKVLLVHGVKDPRAPFENFRRMKKALEEAGNPPQTLVEDGEGHGFYDEDARLRMYSTLLAFCTRTPASARTGWSRAAW